MSIFVIGLNYKTAPLALREQCYFTTDKLPLYLQEILALPGMHEAVLLSTCNRSELYCDADTLSPVIAWFISQAPDAAEALEKALYVHEDVAAIMHLMRVAAGSDSMMLGEAQIFGQLKAAFSESCASDAVGTVFHRLFQQVFSVSKMIRTTTAIGACPVSIASAAVRFAKERVSQFETAHIALIGAGETATLLMRYLESQTQQPITIVNRHPDRALHLVSPHCETVQTFDDLPGILLNADVVFSATSSTHPLIDCALIAPVLALRPSNRPLLLIDLAVPRDIDPLVADLPGVFLYCIDDLKQIIDHHRQSRLHAAEKAEELIQQNSQTLFSELQSLEKVTHAICVYREHMQTLCDAELGKAKSALLKGEVPHHVLETFADALLNKFMHVPSTRLREAGKEGQLEFLHFAKQLFAL